MAAKKRHTSRSVNPHATDDDPAGWSFFQAVRRIDAASADKPRIGCSRHAHEDPVHFRQHPALAFPPSSVAAYQGGSDECPPRLDVNFLGLLGCAGPMPLFFTEYVLSRSRHHADRTLEEFLNVFHHRMISLFYRAWAENQQSASFDRPDNDPFFRFIGSLIGRGTESLQTRDSVPDVAKLHYAGRLAAPTASAEGLRAIVADYFRLPVRVVQFIGKWIAIPESDHCRLGESPSTGSLGTTALVGGNVWDCQHAFRLVLGPVGLAELMTFLPGENSHRRLIDWVRNIIGFEFEWDVQFVLKREEVPPVTLGKGRGTRLGHTTWLHSRPVETDVRDLVLGPFDAVEQNPSRMPGHAEKEA